MLVPLRADGQTEIGAGGGAAFGWSQDVTVESLDSAQHTDRVFHADSLPVRGGSIWQISLLRWIDAHAFVGFELELTNWRNSISIPTWPALESQSFREEHDAFLANFLGRLILSEPRGGYLYGGIGGGLVVSRLESSRPQLGGALSLIGGVCLPAGIRHLHACLEWRYLITRDFDARLTENGTDQNLEISGHPSGAAARPILGPHMDSRFFGVLIAVRWLKNRGSP